MGKIDDMRRMREERMAEQEKALARQAREPRAPVSKAPAVLPATVEAGQDEVEGKGRVAAGATAPVETSTANETPTESAPASAPTAARRRPAANDAPLPEPTTTRSSKRSSKTASEPTEGKCSVCGKVRPLSNGLVGNHQKGFGKMCAGSRKAPA